MFRPLLEVGLSGVINGSVYAMIAVGMALVYGVTKAFNFAYGSFFILAGYLAWVFFSLGLPYVAVLAIVLPVVFGVGAFVDRFALRPLRAKKEWEMLIVMATLGLALLMDNLHLAIYGPYVKALPPLVEGAVSLAGITTSKHNIAAMGISLALITAFLFFINKSRIGLATRAVAQDMVGADIVGIPKDRIFLFAFGISCAMVGMGAIFFAPRYFVTYLGGWDIMVKGWVMTAFGGMGSLLGAVLAGFILGGVEAVVGWQLGYTWTTAVWFFTLIGIFAVRPRGLFGT